MAAPLVREQDRQVVIVNVAKLYGVASVHVHGIPLGRPCAQKLAGFVNGLVPVRWKCRLEHLLGASGWERRVVEVERDRGAVGGAAVKVRSHLGLAIVVRASMLLAPPTRPPIRPRSWSPFGEPPDGSAILEQALAPIV